jgi:hypothetical protein
MYIVVQQTNTDLFLQSLDVWVREREEAMHFTSALGAYDFCRQCNIDGVRLLMCFTDRRFDTPFYTLKRRRGTPSIEKAAQIILPKIPAKPPTFIDPRQELLGLFQDPNENVKKEKRDRPNSNGHG